MSQPQCKGPSSWDSSTQEREEHAWLWPPGPVVFEPCATVSTVSLLDECPHVVQKPCLDDIWHRLGTRLFLPGDSHYAM